MKWHHPQHCLCGAPVVPDPRHRTGSGFCLATGEKWWWCQMAGRRGVPGPFAKDLRQFHVVLWVLLGWKLRAVQEGA